MTAKPGLLAHGPTSALVAGVYCVLATLFAVIQPLRALPDEPAHVEYATFLATAHRLPLWHPTRPEGGYETQHPPFAYLLFAPAAKLGGLLGDDGRYRLLRLAAIVIGLAGVLLATRVCRRVLGDGPTGRWAAAAYAWLPLYLLYACHANPDLVVALLASAILWLSWELLETGPSPRRDAWLGLALCAVVSTKLSGLAAWLPAVAAFALRARRREAGLGRSVALCFGPAVLLAAPWYLRNQMLYGQAVLKAPVHFGSALENALAGRLSFGQLFAMTAGRTYLSSWCQPDWLPGWQTPGGPVGVPTAAIVALYGGLTLLLVVGLAGLRGVEPRVQSFLRLGLLLLAGIVAGQQLAFWTQDVEFNMGGRYVLAAMLPVQVAVCAGLSRRDARLPAAWVGLFLVMNLVAAATIVLVLNPHYHR